MTAIKNKILDSSQVLKKINRLAFEIYENNFQETEIALVGVYPNGLVLAQLLKSELEKISPTKVHLSTIKMNKDMPLGEGIEIDLPASQFPKIPIVIVDDVLNSGRTMFYSFRPFLDSPLKKIQVAVLVDRAHKKFPISADYVGYSLGTTLQEFVEVNLNHPDEYAVYLL
jgi:pyrimidine operon attenuation protein / uracil phosphoribosyltransferase